MTLKVIIHLYLSLSHTQTQRHLINCAYPAAKTYKISETNLYVDLKLVCAGVADCRTCSEDTASDTDMGVPDTCSPRGVVCDHLCCVFLHSLVAREPPCVPTYGFGRYSGLWR